MSATIIPFPTQPLTDLEGLRQQHVQDLASLAAHALERAKASRRRLTDEQVVAIAQQAVVGDGSARAAGLPLGLVLAAKISLQIYQQASAR